MKDKLKNLMKNKLFIGSAAAVLVLIIAVTAVLLLPDKTAEPVKEPETSAADSTVTPPEIKVPDTASETEPSVTEKPEELPSDVSVDVGDISQNTGDESGGKAEEPVKPVVPVEPEKPADTDNGGNGGGIVIGGNPPVEENYSCGAENHHCQDSDTHAWILNLELEGCGMCGSHSCPSFYATNEWGGASIDYTKCPKYSVTNDPAKYCQVCGREMWSQSNPTGCFSYLQDTQCECGELVEGNTCHHH